jgi:hypothetical protein
MLDDIFFMVVFFESLASQGSEKISSQNALLAARLVVIVFTTVAPCEALAAATTEVEKDIDGGSHGGTADGSVAATTKVEEDVDGGSLRGATGGSGRATTEVEENVNGRPLEGTIGGSHSGHHRV